MGKIKWVKQLTRENTLLDRSLRTIAYAQSVKEIGRAKIAKCPVVGEGNVTSWYYSLADYRFQQKIILKEFTGSRISAMGNQIANFLEQGYLWAKSQHRRKLAKPEFIKFIKQLNFHHAHSRGAIVYGYWGEPIIAERLRKLLLKKVSAAEVDMTISKLSAPKIVLGKLTVLYHPSLKVEREKQGLIRRLKLNAKEKDLVEILSWFTFFYELGERVSSLLYDELLNQLKSLVSKKELNELFWYDPLALINYFNGRKLTPSEIRRRKQRYILLINRGVLQVLSGEKAEKYFNKEFNLETGMNKTLKEIKGTPASPGIAKGTVKIVTTQADQKKMQKNNILVSPMTTPRLMLAVSKAAAIVTDEGGLTAHAAIVSRELKIPCIVGTKLATKILKDGDLVEVDANKGIIRKIN